MSWCLARDQARENTARRPVRQVGPEVREHRAVPADRAGGTVMLFGAANIDLGALGIPDVTGYREHLYQLTDGKIVFPSVNGPIPAVWPTTPAGVTGFYTIYPTPDRLPARPVGRRL